MTVSLSDRHQVSNTSLKIPPFGLGGVFIGDPVEKLTEPHAQAVLQTAWDEGVRYFDTAPWYGNTLSEHRLGHFLRQQPRDDFVITTKVGRVYFRPDDIKAYKNSRWMERWRGGLEFDLRFDYTAQGVTRSYEDSLMRLGLNTVDALVIHDLDPRHQEGEERVALGLDQLDKGGGFQVLKDLRDSGEIKAIGAGINHIGMIPRFLERFDMDYFLVAMPYTLLDQPALDGEFQMCADRNVSVVIGAVFASGILATGPTQNASYAYQNADQDVIERVQGIQQLCDKHSVSLPAAAMQFPLAHPVVGSVIPGANACWQIEHNVAALTTPIPGAFWNDLKAAGLLRNDAPTGV